MKHLIYFNWQLDIPFFGIMIDHIDKILLDPANEIHFISCDGILNNCFTNKFTNRNICVGCTAVNKIGLKKFVGKIKQYQIGALISKDRNYYNNLRFNYSNVLDIKKIRYNGVQIGYGALSSYVSYTRNQDPLINDEFEAYFNDLLISQAMLADAMANLIDKIIPDEIHVYNGRWADVRPVFDLAIKYTIKINVLESINNGKSSYNKEIYQNVLPQNIRYRHNLLNNLWENNVQSVDEKIEIATNFFKKRKNSELIAERKIYTQNQVKGLLPNNFDFNKRNVVIFNSSEDEFVALGQEYDSYALFNNQEEGIRYMLENSKNKNIQFYLRIHPNLSEVPFNYHTRLLKLEKEFSNLIVIPGDSAISTYGLIDSATCVVVFSSTVGVEACFWGKPVVLLSGAGYYYLDVAYIPKVKEEIIDLISKDLVPKDKLGALKFGYFLTNTKLRTQRINYNPIQFKLFGVEFFSYFNILRIFKSAILFRMVYQIWNRLFIPLLTVFFKPKYNNIPIKDNL